MNGWSTLAGSVSVVAGATVPAVSTMFTAASGWTVRRRAVALGVLVTGHGLGTLLLVPLAERLTWDGSG